MKPLLPKARNNDLVIQEMENEILIYDLIKNKAIVLNQSLATVWRYCDGISEFDDVIREFAASRQHQIEDDFIWFALQKLHEADLLQTESVLKNLSRREVIIKYGAAAVALPVIATLIAPTAVSAQSCAAGGFAPGTPVNATVASGGTDFCQRILESQCCSRVVTNYTWNTSPTSQDGSCDAQCK